MFKSNNIDMIYRCACIDLINSVEEVKGTKEVNNYCFQLTDLNNNIVNIRNISESYLLAELLWYTSGRNDVEYIGKFASMWNRISDDGVTSNSAYGHILFKRHGFDQLEKIIELLEKDPESRRAVINFNVPNPNVIETKDEICTIALQFMIRDNKLNCTCMMRSNDIWFGLPYDVTFFTELQKYVARRLGVGYGTYTHFAVSLHVYERNYKDIQKVLYKEPTTKLELDYDKLLEHREELIKLDKEDLFNECCMLRIIKEQKL